MKRLALALALTVAGAAAFPSRAVAVQVSTLAGSGAPGFADGAGAAASFMMPEGLALAPDGAIYVADAAAQRIRRIAHNGSVTTIAGSGEPDASHLWVPGGYANGSALSARFDEPAAVAVAPSGAIVVADSGNHCLRIVAGGAVSDFAGACGSAGSSDGAAPSARFDRPRALAYDSQGVLYVGDAGNGVRRIAPDGQVTTLRPDAPFDKAFETVTGLSAVQSANGPMLYVATRDGLCVVYTATAKLYAFYKAGQADTFESSTFVAGSHPFGYPYAVAALNQYEFAYTDIATNAVRYFAFTMADEAVGWPVEDAGFESGDFRDGDGTQARVDQPMGIVRRPDGTFVVADTGNRRVRIVSGVDFRYQTLPADLSAHAGEYRIVYLGDSIVSYDLPWNESVAGILEKRLRGNWQALGFPRPPRVFPISVITGLEGTKEYVDTYLTSGLADMVILQLNSGQIAFSLNVKPPANLVPLASQWQPLVTSTLRGIKSELAKAGVPLVVAIHPLPFELAPSESGWLYQYPSSSLGSAPAAPGEYARFGPLLREAVAGAGVPEIDAFGAFAREELAADRPALFGARDFHFSLQGAQLDAAIIYDELARTRPWKQR